ncbi:DUF1249 domain-containing protein [Methylocaldum sp.]|uniref:DUF1249 domain-containing protein n=1 Tax=Methylocaldum sp. TaxID=1969727 RepID=UPI002D43B53E|nr:DUF1249 domain-containing protein [Methylocaldum sp.]HYE34799.1 DUF1249 domain-containing protein [Methylocaldum sp.]
MSIFQPAEKSFWLQKVCESNYEKLANLIPDLTRIDETAVAQVNGKPSLHLRLLDRSPYTLTLELTHDFVRDFEPAVKIRVSLDAKTAEALSDYCRPFVLDAVRDRSNAENVLDYKWSLNYFLTRWLDHCLQSDYRFGTARYSREEFVTI